MKTTLDTPTECPLCGSRIHVACKLRDQPSTTGVKIFGFLATLALALTVHPYVGLGVGIVLYTFAQSRPKLRDFVCGKCRWKGSFLVVRKFNAR